MRGRVRRRAGKKSEDIWQLIIDLEPDPVTGKRRRQYQQFRGTRREAERELAKLVHTAESGPTVEPTRETVAQFFERWLLNYVETNVAPKTRMYYVQVVRQHIIPRLGTKRLQQLKQIDLVEAERFWLNEGWLRTKTRRGLSPKSVANMHRILALALQHAVEWKLLPVSPIGGLRPPRWERKEQSWLDLPQARALVDHLESTPAGTAVLLKLSTGLRMGELLGLRWRDVDLAAHSIALQQQLQWLSGQGYVMRAVKSHRSRRPISIDVDLVDVLRSYKARQSEARLLAGALWNAGDLVFTSEVGVHLTPDQVRRALLRALRAAGLPRIRPHDLRHTHASALLRLRTPMKVVQERLGHSSFAVTADIYSHVAPDLQEQAAGLFGAALREGTQSRGDSTNSAQDSARSQ